jgi:hypothetical protein
MAKNHIVVPEALPQRPDLSHNRYKEGITPLGLDGVSVEFGTPTKPHTYNAPTGDGLTSRRLRRYALTLTRFQLPSIRLSAKAWKLPTSIVANTVSIVTTSAYRKAYNDDPTIDTVDVKPLVAMLNEDNTTKEVIAKALSYVNTQAFETILSTLGNEDLKEHLINAKSTLDYWDSGWHWDRLKRINSTDKYDKRNAKREYRELAERLDRASNGIVRQLEEATKQKASEYGENVREGFTDGTDNWYPIFVDKPELSINHTGKLGRRNVYTDTGRSVKNVSRLYTDPERRIFTRKTRALGAVVVIDCSGSMSLSQEDLESLMSVSAGATVLCYSTGNEPSKTEPNGWIVARKGRQVRHLPHFPGGNGCDGPALLYAQEYLRDNSKQPLIWVSDEQVTGRGNCSDVILSEQCDRLKEKYNIKVASDVEEAIHLMRKLQGKG